MATGNAPGVIKKLDEVVINRIAAGEVIQRPANALKEMLENSLDAKATSISVLVDRGGLGLLQIMDNGTGIRKEDMGIVAERFTTSKLSAFDDLKTISTYGFRGEALASISHVARLTILSKTAEAEVGYRASYKDGKILGSEPEACAANRGTQINVEDLFYNLPSRKRALKNPSEEFNRIAEVVSKYAIHNSKIGFTLKKKGEGGVEIRTQPESTPRENIAVIYGSLVAKELTPLEVEDEALGFTTKGLISNVNYSCKKNTMLLFINHRLVENSMLKKAVETVYSAYLPKGMHPFTYLSMEIKPENVDVNVHPTKHEVHFLHQDEIVEKIQQAIDAKLLGSNTFRNIATKTLLPGAPIPSSDKISTTSSHSVSAKNLVRTDSKDQKLDKFLTIESKSQGKDNPTVGELPSVCDVDTPVKRRDIKLASVRRLVKEIEDNAHEGLRNLIVNHTFVGCVNRKFSLLQHNTQLYLVKNQSISRHLFYQILLKDFGNFGAIRLNPPAPIEELALMAMDDPESSWREEDGSKPKLASYVVNFLKEKSEMLDDYFSMEIDENGNLCSLPMLVENFIPFLGGLPIFLMRLATEVNWEDEEECFRTFCLETANFYAIQPDEVSTYDCKQHEKGGGDSEKWKYTVEHIIFDRAKRFLLPPKKCVEDMTFLQIANLSDLYKVFERC